MQLPDGKPLPNSGMARRVALDVARGLHFLHAKKIVHFVSIYAKLYIVSLIVMLASLKKLRIRIQRNWRRCPFNDHLALWESARINETGQGPLSNAH